MIRSKWRALALAVLPLAAVLLAACAKNSTGKIKDFTSDLNKHDVSRAMSLTAPNFTLTEANGTTVQGSAAASALQSLQTPIKVVSITKKGGRSVKAVLTFGSGPATTVDFAGTSKSSGGRSGHIMQMKISGP